MKVFVKGLTYIAILLGFVGIFFLAFRQELFQIKKVSVVSVSGSHPILFKRVEESIQPLLTKLEGKWMWNIHLDKILSEVLIDKRIKEVNIQRQLPGKVSVFIQTHQPIAVVMQGSGIYHPVASDGSLLPEIQLKEVLDAPILRGVQLFNDQDLRKQVIAYLWELPIDGAFSLNNISEVSWTKGQGLKVIMQSSGTLIYMGEEDFNSKTKHIEKVLNYLNKEGLSGRVIDARFSKKVLVKLRNGS